MLRAAKLSLLRQKSWNSSYFEYWRGNFLKTKMIFQNDSFRKIKCYIAKALGFLHRYPDCKAIGGLKFLTSISKEILQKFFYSFAPRPPRMRFAIWFQLKLFLFDRWHLAGFHWWFNLLNLACFSIQMVPTAQKSRGQRGRDASEWDGQFVVEKLLWIVLPGDEALPTQVPAAHLQIQLRRRRALLPVWTPLLPLRSVSFFHPSYPFNHSTFTRLSKRLKLRYRASAAFAKTVSWHFI